MADADVVSLPYRDALAMDLYRPSTGPGPWSIVVLLHGVTSDPSPKDNGGLVGWGQALAARGLAAAVIDSRPDRRSRRAGRRGRRGRDQPAAGAGGGPSPRRIAARPARLLGRPAQPGDRRPRPGQRAGARGGRPLPAARHREGRGNTDFAGALVSGAEEQGSRFCWRTAPRLGTRRRLGPTRVASCARHQAGRSPHRRTRAGWARVRRDQAGPPQPRDHRTGAGVPDQGAALGTAAPGPLRLWGVSAQTPKRSRCLLSLNAAVRSVVGQHLQPNLHRVAGLDAFRPAYGLVDRRP